MDSVKFGLYIFASTLASLLDLSFVGKNIKRGRVLCGEESQERGMEDI